MKRWLALASGVCPLALGAIACSPDDTPSGDAVELDGAAVPSSEGGLTTDASSVRAMPDAGAVAVIDSAVGSVRDASGADAAVSPDASITLDAAREAGASDASSALEAAVDTGPPDASSSATPTASAGCGKSGRPSGGRVSVAGQHNYVFPAAYDGQRPFPLLLGFHAASNPIEQIENLTKGSELETHFVRAFPKSQGSAWDYNTDIAKVSAMYDELMSNYCIDTSRVFATGHSSGAQLIVQILTPARKADADHFKLKAVAPVAASRYGSVSRAIPVLYIQGSHDSVRNSDGSDVVKEFVSANGCMMTTKPYAAPMCTSSGKAVSNGCKQYDGCKAPTVWCSHDDPAYSNTSHGWPCFASKAMYDFFVALP
jgi:polyhydroxybutyrate depolymerase